MSDSFINWFRATSPYVHAHRGKTFVLAFSGRAVADDNFSTLIHDIALLHGLGIRLVLVHGSRPQIEERLRLRNAEMAYINGLRVTDETALTCVKEAAGSVRVEIEALFSTAASNSPMAGARIRVISGNFVTARPIGVRDGTDYLYTGEVRRIETRSICTQLEAGNLVVIPPLGYSPTGEVFNLSSADVAAAVAASINADKLILLGEGEGLFGEDGELLRQLNPEEAALMAPPRDDDSELSRHLAAACGAARRGVGRTHLLSWRDRDALLGELFTRDGIGTMITRQGYEQLRKARLEDVGGLLALLGPLEQRGILVARSRERLEHEIDDYVVLERDGMVIGCAALHLSLDAAMGELACVAVHDDYRRGQRGEQRYGDAPHGQRLLLRFLRFLLSSASRKRA